YHAGQAQHGVERAGIDLAVGRRHEIPPICWRPVSAKLYSRSYHIRYRIIVKGRPVDKAGTSSPMEGRRALAAFIRACLKVLGAGRSPVEGRDERAARLPQPLSVREWTPNARFRPSGTGHRSPASG